MTIYSFDRRASQIGSLAYLSTPANKVGEVALLYPQASSTDCDVCESDAANWSARRMTAFVVLACGAFWLCIGGMLLTFS